MKPSLVTSLLALNLLAAADASAQTTHVWTDASPLNRNWSNGANWLSGSSPAKALTSDIVLSTNQSTGSTNGVWNPPAIPIVDQPWTVRSLDLRMTPSPEQDHDTNPEFPAELSGQEITVGAGGISNNSEFYHQKINNALRIVRNQEWRSSSWTNFIGPLYAPLVLAGPIHFDVPALAEYYEVTIPSDVRPTLVYGNVQLHNNITGTGRITVADGAYLRIGSNSATTVNAPDSIFRIQSGGMLFMPSQAAATLVAGTVDLGGTIELRTGSHTLEASVLQGGGTIRGSLPGNAPGTVRHTGTTNQTFAGRFENTPKLVKTGSGALTFTRSEGAGTLSELQLNAGRIILDNNAGLSAQNLSGQGTVEIRAGSGFGGSSGTFFGTITGEGHFNAGSINLFQGSNPTHTSGSLSVGGTLTLGPSNFFHTGSLSGSGTVMFDANAEIRVGEDSTFSGNFSNLGTLSNPRGRVEVADNRLVTLNGSAKQHAFDQLHLRPGSELRVSNGGQLLVRAYPQPSGTLGAIGDGTLLLAENATHPFRARISAADGIVTLGFTTPLQLQATGVAHQIKRLNLASAGLMLRGGSSLSVAELNGSANLQIDAGTTVNITDFANSGFTGAFQDGPDGPGALTVSIGSTPATKTLRAGSFSGPVTLSGSTGSVFRTLAGTAPTGPIAINSGTRLEATDINNSSVTMNIGSQLVLASVSSPAGPVHGGCMTGTFNQPAGASLLVEINDRPSRPSGYGRVRASGDITLGGSLEVTLNNTFGAQPGDRWTIYETTGGVINGFIAAPNRTVSVTNLPEGTELVWVQTPTTLELQLQSIVTDPPGYYTWASSNGLTPANRGPFLDADDDGFPNWREYLLGLNPLAADQPAAPVEAVTNAGQPVFRFRHAPGIDFNAEFEVQGSADLGVTDAWSSTKATSLGNGTLPDGFSFRDFRFHVQPPAAPQGFLRLRYTGLVTHPDD